MLEGQSNPITSLFEELAVTAKLAVICVPMTMVAGGMILLGTMAMGHANHFGDLLICLPAGLLLATILAWCVFYAVWLSPRRTILAFRFDGSELAFFTPT